MWIRTQDKDRLMDVDEFETEPTAIWGFSKLREKGHVLLGQYNTESRTMEVLDEIQRQLVVGISYDTLYHGRRNIHQKVFNMPKE